MLPELNLSGVEQNSEAGRLLVQAFTNAKVIVTAAAKTELKITRFTKAKRVLSLDNNGRANQYELSYQLSFVLLRKKTQAEKEVEQVLLPAQTITEKREYLFDANQVLAKADEENRLYRDMQEAAILQLLRRLQFSLKRQVQK